MLKKYLYKYPYLSIILLVVLFYWPLYSTLFSPKNDNIVYFLSSRYNISNALHNGYIPFWQPNIYFGLPLHGDMQSGFWNPLVWLLSLFGKYNVTTLTIEIIIYLVVGAIGLFNIARYTGNSIANAFFISLTYISCGFIADVSGQNIAFLAAAAFIPHLWFSLWLYLKRCTIKNLSYSIVSGFILVVAAYPSFTIVALYGCIGIVLVQLYRQPNKVQLLLNTFVLAGLAIIALLPILYSYYEYSPYYNRGAGGIGYSFASTNALTPQSLLSFLFPLATTNIGEYNTDPIMRNVFIGLLIMPILVGFKTIIKTNIQKAIALILLLFLLLSLGEYTPLHFICFKVVPFFNYFRHPSNFRYFALLLLLLLVCYSKILTNKKILQLSIKAYAIIIAASVFIALTLLITTKQIQSLFTDVVSMYNNINTLTGVLFEGGLALIIYLLWKWKYKVVSFIGYGFFVLISFHYLQTFKTIVGKKSNKNINQAIAAAKKDTVGNISSIPIEMLSANDRNYFDYIGNASYYKPYPTFSWQQTTPTIANNYTKWIADTSNVIKLLKNNIAGYYPLGASSTGLNYTISFTNDCIKLVATVNTDTSIYITQNYHHLLRATINEQPTNLAQKSNFPFVVLQLSKGVNDVIIEYDSRCIKHLTLICLLIFVIFMIAIYYSKYFNTSKLKH